MGWPRQRRLAAFWVLAPALLTSGCVYQPLVKFSAPGGDAPAEELAWWAARYRHSWPEGEEPRWHQDLCVAHEIVAPVLKEHRHEIALWRFHRRAARDGAWHQFSFLFYATPETARRIFAALQARPALAEFKDAGLLRQDVYEVAGMPEPRRVEATSDRRWSPLVQAAWPYFIMGVSENWLALVTLELARRPPAESSGIEERLEACRQSQFSLSALWRREGYHAYLHHLNAVFGYTPLLTPDGEERAF